MLSPYSRHLPRNEQFKQRLVGTQFDLLTVVARTDKRTSKKLVLWECRCDCGNIRFVDTGTLMKGQARHCGCSVWRDGAFRRLHKQSQTSEYRSWRHVIARCTDPANPASAYYGGRGITVCERWLVFENFLADMGRKPSRDCSTIERLNNDGNYEPSNCVWATRKQQQNNRRACHYVTINGQTKTIKEWSEIAGISYSAMIKRVRKGWPEHKLLSPPDPAFQRF